jgi:hypothetical protein
MGKPNILTSDASRVQKRRLDACAVKNFIEAVHGGHGRVCKVDDDVQRAVHDAVERVSRVADVKQLLTTLQLDALDDSQVPQPFAWWQIGKVRDRVHYDSAGEVSPQLQAHQRATYRIDRETRNHLCTARDPI